MLLREIQELPDFLIRTLLPLRLQMNLEELPSSLPPTQGECRGVFFLALSGISVIHWPGSVPFSLMSLFRASASPLLFF